MSYASPQAYKEAAILTASPEQLVVMLYDGAIRFLRQGEMAMREGMVAQTNDRLQRAEAIIDELLGTLNMEAGDISQRLQSIYVFSRKLLVEARVERDPAKVGQVVTFLTDLREAWAQIAGTA
jgi:flagellar protein FliS